MHAQPSAGSMYCAVASMELLGTLKSLPAKRREGIVEWCVKRQVSTHVGPLADLYVFVASSAPAQVYMKFYDCEIDAVIIRFLQEKAFVGSLLWCSSNHLAVCILAQRWNGHGGHVAH